MGLNVSLTSERGQEMLSYLPPYYAQASVLHAILQAEGLEFDKLRAALDETLEQAFARRATWALDRWEEELGLAPAPYLTDAERQDRIVAKIRSNRTATIAAVRDTASAYGYGTVEVIEDHANYAVTLRLIDTRGVPPDAADFERAMQELIPAHLTLNFVYRYLTWAELGAEAWTWDGLDGTDPPNGPAGAPLTWDELETYRP